MDDSEDFSILPGFEGLEELYAIEDVCNESSMHHLQEPGYKTGNVAFMDSGSVWTEHAQSQETGQSGIQAMTMESLLDQFEDTTTVSSNGRDYIQFHNVTDDAPLHSQSLPVSRVCSAANSPAPTPPASPPPDILHKIRSNHNQPTKRKAAIMLPYLAPTKRGKGKVGMLETPTAASRTSRLQKILSRNTSTPSELPEGLQPNLSAVLQPIQLVGVDSVGVGSVRHTGGVVTSVVSPTATSVPADLRMSRITDPGMAQSILSKTPRALSLLAGPVSSENLAKNSQANNTAVKNSIGSKSSNAVQVLNMQNTASGFVSLLPKPATDLNCATSSEALNQSVTVSRGTPVPPLKPSVAKKQEEPQKRCDIVLSRSAEQIPAEGLQSVLDHDYCHDSLRRVIVDEFDLLVSPTKSHCQKPLQKVKSLPILPSGQSAKTQIVSKANDVGQTVGAAGRATTTQGQPLRVGAVTTSTSKITSNMGAVNSNAVINLIAPSTSAGSAATAVVHNTQEKQNVRSVPAVSNPPQPVTVSLMSVLSKVQNIESLFTLENGTLKLHPSVAASINPAAFVTPVPQNSQQVGPSVGSVTVNSSDQKNGLIQGRSTAKVVPNAPRYVQQNVPTSSMNSANTAVKNQQQATTPVIPLIAPTPRLAKVSSIPVPNSAKTDINRNTSNQPKKPLSDRANTSSVTRNATSGKEENIPPAQAQRKKKQDQYSRSTEVVNDTPPPEVPSSCCLEQIKVAPMKGISKKPGDFDADNQQSELNDSQSDSTTNSQETSVMYSMPVFDFDEPSTTGMSDRVVTPVKIQTCAEESPTTQQSPKITPQPYSPQTCDEKPQPRQPSPRSPPVSPKDDPHACSPCTTSPEAGTSHEPMQQYVDEFDLIWEEHEQEAAAQGRASLERRTVTYHDQSRPESSRGAGTNRGRGASRRGRKSGKWQPGSSPVKEDSSGFFSKIPSYYTALSIPTKTGRKQLTAEDAEGLTIHDFIPADHDPVHSTEDREWYDKMPSYFSCFTNSTKYDSAVTHGDFGKVDQTKKAVGSSFVGGSPKSPSPGHSQRKSPSPTTSQRRSREGVRSRKRRRSNSSSVSSGSRSRSWKTGKRRQRRSPSGSGSCRSSSGSRIVERSDLPAFPWALFSSLRKVVILQIHHCSIGDSSHFLSMKSANFTQNITDLNLQWNHIQRIDSNLLLLIPSIEHLNLATNHITEIEEGCFRLTQNLSNLDLSNNNLGAAMMKPGALSGLHRVRDLRLQNCSIREFHPRVFKDLHSLMYLHLAGNHLSVVPVDSLTAAPRLILLNLGSNNIMYVDNSLSRLYRLHILFLHDNPLESISSRALDGFERLDALTLFNTKLRYLPVGLQPTLQQMPEPGALSLANVTWRCDCRLLWLVRLLQSTGMTSSQSAPTIPRCYLPRHLSNTSLRDISLESLRCPKLAGCEEDELSSVKCEWCPPFQKPLHGGKQCECMEGYEYTHHLQPVCQPCPMGFYKEGVNNGQCVQCPANSTSLAVGASFCVCLDGFTRNPQQTCQPCEANTFKTKLGNHRCERCPTGSQGPVGSNHIAGCQCQRKTFYVNVDLMQCVSPNVGGGDEGRDTNVTMSPAKVTGTEDTTDIPPFPKSETPSDGIVQVEEVNKTDNRTNTIGFNARPGRPPELSRSLGQGTRQGFHQSAESAGGRDRDEKSRDSESSRMRRSQSCSPGDSDRSERSCRSRSKERARRSRSPREDKLKEEKERDKERDRSREKERDKDSGRDRCSRDDNRDRDPVRTDRERSSGQERDRDQDQFEREKRDRDRSPRESRSREDDPDKERKDRDSEGDSDSGRDRGRGRDEGRGRNRDRDIDAGRDRDGGRDRDKGKKRYREREGRQRERNQEREDEVRFVKTGWRSGGDCDRNREDSGGRGGHRGNDRRDFPGRQGCPPQSSRSPGQGARPKTSDGRRGFRQPAEPARVGLIIAISVGVVVVAAMLLVLVLSLICSKRLPCHKQADFFTDNSDSSGRHLLEVTIENNIVCHSAPDFELHIRRLRVGRLLGRGAFGQVHAGMLFGCQYDVKKNFHVAVKKIKDKAADDERKALQEELEQMLLVGPHPNIIQLIGSCMHDGSLHIIMELAEQGDLLNYLRQGKLRHEQYVSVGPDGTLREQKALHVTDHYELMLFSWHIAKGMSHLESVKCIHRDLAARNCLLTSGPAAKLSDFGLSRDVYENGYYLRHSKGRVPYKWLSPEALLWGQYSNKSDVWSYGILLWEIATFGGTPYSGIPPDRIADMHRTRYRLPQPPACPDKLYRVMRCCWHEDPRKRPTFRTLCDVMEVFVQAAADNKYLDLQGVTRPTLSGITTPTGDVPKYQNSSSPFLGQRAHGGLHPETFVITSVSPHSSRLSLKRSHRADYSHSHSGLAQLNYLTLASEDDEDERERDSGGEMGLDEEGGIELKPMLMSSRLCSEERSEAGSTPVSHCGEWDDSKDGNREQNYTSGYSSSRSILA